MAATIANILTAVLVLVAAVTLAVGGVGIMNIMLANVRARIREIGIRKALGATYREIKLQFLAEAIIISLSGGIVGMISWVSRCPLSIRLFTDYPLPILVVVSLDRADRSHHRRRHLRHRPGHARRADGPRRGPEV